MPKVQLYFIDKELINPLHNNDFKFETKTIGFLFLRGRQFYKAPLHNFEQNYKLFEYMGN
jgi:hypothetical protein